MTTTPTTELFLRALRQGAAIRRFQSAYRLVSPEDCKGIVVPQGVLNKLLPHLEEDTRFSRLGVRIWRVQG